MIPFLSVVFARKDRLFEVMSKQKSKKERNIQAFVRSEAHQITRKGYEGWRFLFITFSFNTFKILLSLLHSVHRKKPNLVPRALFWFHDFGKKPRRHSREVWVEVCHRSLQALIPCLRQRLLVVQKWTTHRQPSTHFLDTQCKTFTPKTGSENYTITLRAEAAFSRYKLLFLFARQLMRRKRSTARRVAVQGPAHSHLGHIRKCPPQSHPPFGGAGVVAPKGKHGPDDLISYQSPPSQVTPVFFQLDCLRPDSFSTLFEVSHGIIALDRSRWRGFNHLGLIYVIFNC